MDEKDYDNTERFSFRWQDSKCQAELVHHALHCNDPKHNWIHTFKPASPANAHWHKVIKSSALNSGFGPYCKSFALKLGLREKKDYLKISLKCQWQL